MAPRRACRGSGVDSSWYASWPTRRSPCRYYAKAHMTTTVLVFENTIDWMAGNGEPIACSAMLAEGVDDEAREEAHRKAGPKASIDDTVEVCASKADAVARPVCSRAGGDARRRGSRSVRESAWPAVLCACRSRRRTPPPGPHRVAWWVPSSLPGPGWGPRPPRERRRAAHRRPQGAI